MVWDRTVGRAMSEAMEDDNLEEFNRLLDAHPDHLRGPDGRDCWMRSAAHVDKVQFLQTLLDRGIDVNESSGDRDPESTFYEPEGPVLWAASEGQLEAVRWLLSHGARINYVVREHIRCMPMMFAATNGHLEVVKLLVEHGGEWQSSDDGRPPAWYAKEYGQTAVLEYLQSLEK